MSISKITRNAKKGIGSDAIMELPDYETLDIYAGKLEEIQKKFAAEAQKVNKDAAPDKLGGYFGDMEKKQNLTMTNARLQRKLEENRERRNIMKAQFGQFSSFPAVKLMEDGVVESIVIGGKKIDSILKKCNYLFYE